MRQKAGTQKAPAEQVIKDIRRATRKQYGAEEKIRIVLEGLRGGAPEVMRSFSGIAQAALKANTLDTKTKELIALGISVPTRCDECIGFHAKAAVEKGATREEALETLGMAIYMARVPRRCMPAMRSRPSISSPGRRLRPNLSWPTLK
jgi:AhpD family alkylhydroperoxidase